MYENKKKKNTVKKSSNGIQSTELLKTLQKAILTLEATVSYVFVSEKISNVHSNDLKKMNVIEEKSILHVNLPASSLFEKTPNEVIHMLETTKWDLGAKYFIIS